MARKNLKYLNDKIVVFLLYSDYLFSIPATCEINKKKIIEQINTTLSFKLIFCGAIFFSDTLLGASKQFVLSIEVFEGVGVLIS